MNHLAAAMEAGNFVDYRRGIAPHQKFLIIIMVYTRALEYFTNHNYQVKQNRKTIVIAFS